MFVRCAVGIAFCIAMAGLAELQAGTEDAPQDKVGEEAEGVAGGGDCDQCRCPYKCGDITVANCGNQHVTFHLCSSGGEDTTCEKNGDQPCEPTSIPACNDQETASGNNCPGSACDQP